MKQERKSRPGKVSTALYLLWIALFVGIIASAFNFSSSLEIANAPPGFGLGVVIFILCFGFLLSAFFIWKIGQGRNWARITYLVLFILGIPVVIYTLLTIKVSTFLIIMQIAHTIVSLVALVFLFQKQSSDWFKSTKN